MSLLVHDVKKGTATQTERSETKAILIQENNEKMAEEKAAKFEARSSAESKLIALGLTPEDLKALLG